MILLILALTTEPLTLEAPEFQRILEDAAPYVDSETTYEPYVRAPFKLLDEDTFLVEDLSDF